MTIEEALALPRVAIAGGPHTGKSFLLDRILDGRDKLSTDDLIGKFDHLAKAERWSAASAEAVRWANERQRFAIEGVRVAHALRKGLRCDVVIWLTRVWPKPGKPRMAEHESQAKAVKTVFDEWRQANANGARIPIVSI